MKRIDEKDLARVALDKGAVVVVDGKRVNAAGQKLDLARRESPKPAVPESRQVDEASTNLVPPPPDRSGEMLAAAVIQSGQQTAAIVESLVRELRARQSPETSVDAPVVEWNFSIHRDERTQLVTGITAFATREGKP